MKKRILLTGLLFFISFQIFGQIKEDKSYMIIATHSKKALGIKPDIDLNANRLQLQQNDSTGNDNQLFYFKKIKSGYFQIIVKFSNKSLEVRNGSFKDHDTIQQGEFKGYDYQLFTLIKNPNGAYAIINKNSGFGFDVLGGIRSFDNNTAVIQYPVSGAPNQLFKIVEFDNTQKAATEILPGKGLAQHNFLYAGESGNRRVYIIKDGKVVWFYDDPSGKGEVSDAVMLSNGNILIAHQFAINLISPEKKIIWNYDAPDGTEIHTAMPIGTDHVLFIQNSNPAMVKVINITTGEIKKQFQIPVANPKSTHGQFRHARITPTGTLLVCHMDMNKVCEYNSDGKEIWSFPADVPWGATPLKNGNVLIVDRQDIREVNHRGETAAQFSRMDAGKYKLGSLQLAWRLPNGNTIINNWENEWNGPIDKTKNPPIQAVELTPDKKVVWVLKSWKEPDLGPATTIQILDEPTAPENVTFGDIK